MIGGKSKPRSSLHFRCLLRLFGRNQILLRDKAKKLLQMFLIRTEYIMYGCNSYTTLGINH